MGERIGIFGGSFDPVHYGHLLLAEEFREQCQLNRVLFVPAHIPPHKQQGLAASSNHRLEMLRLAIAGHPALDICELEVQRGGVSYTVDTVRDLAKQNPDAELLMLIGADTLADLPNWREPAEICNTVTMIVARRHGQPQVDFGSLGNLLTADRVEAQNRAQVSLPIIELSSTDIRERVAAGKSIRFRVPRAVEKYIETHGLYLAE